MGIEIKTREEDLMGKVNRETFDSVTNKVSEQEEDMRKAEKTFPKWQTHGFSSLGTESSKGRDTNEMNHTTRLMIRLKKPKKTLLGAKGHRRSHHRPL